ncbi:MAG TPA: response regulator [Holophagaceae bacterium]|nr:response regulator [Holophagaceae bacterium]
MSEGPRILCIEDNPMNWRLVQRLLGQAGFEMHWASEGLKGYEMAIELMPALILLDINLPGLSGFEVATKLRQNRDLDSTLIVALTAKTMKADRDTALVTGCDGFISKPIDPFRFVDQVKSYLEGRRDRIEASREGETLRQFSQQVVEHLEDQLRELQDSNKKLLEAQAALEQRNALLSGLVQLSQAIVALHDPKVVERRVMGKAAEDMGLSRMAFFQTHESGGYLQGSAWDGDFKDLPVLATDHPMVQRLLASRPTSALWGDPLDHSPFRDEGTVLGLWGPRQPGMLFALWSREREDQLWGLLALAREPGRSFQAFESETLALYGGLLQVSLENAGLIAHLNETSRALASSFDRLESAYQELQEAQRALIGRERQAVLGDLFQKVARRLQGLTTRMLEGSREAGAPPGLGAPAEEMDGLVQALLRRTTQSDGGSPEQLDLQSLVRQELELLRAEGGIPEATRLSLALDEKPFPVFGVASDFAQTLRNFVQHAVGGGSSALAIRTESADGAFRLSMEDQGGTLGDEVLNGAFHPFARLGEAGTPLGRQAGQGLPVSAQLMAPYEAALRIENIPGGTRLTLELQAEPESPREGSLS